MAKQDKGVAEIGPPGEVLSPNAGSENLVIDDNNALGQFGTELENPNKKAPDLNPDAVQRPGSDAKSQDPTDEQKRFEYWQSVAQKNEQKAKDLETKLAQVTPLVDFVSKDEDTYRYVQSRLNGNRTPDKPLEPPQKPNNYNEVEAFSNPESASFKYRNDLEAFRDAKLVQLERQNATLYQQRQQEAEQLQQQNIEREKMVKFQQAIIAEGVAPEDFPDFWNTVRNADHPTMVAFYKWRKAQAQQSNPDNESLRFDVPLTSSAGNNQRSKPLDMGDIFVEAHKRMM